MENKIEELMEETYYESIDALRLLFAFMICIVSYGIPMVKSEIFRATFGTATIGFYIISGFLMFREPEKTDARLKRAIGRSGRTLLVLAVFYLLCMVVYCLYLGAPLSSLLPNFRSKRFWFETLVMCIWPYQIGGSIWFLQALFYGYIILFLMKKLHLLKLDIVLIVLLLGVTLVTGELAAVFRPNILGYGIIPANVFNRALPYMLLGSVLGRKAEDIEEMHVAVPWCLAALGFVLSLGEMYLLTSMNLLVYTGHILGNGVCAAGLCMAAIRAPWATSGSFLAAFGRDACKAIYWLQQPLGFLMTNAVIYLSYGLYEAYGSCISIAVFVILSMLTAGYQLLRYRFFGEAVEEEMEALEQQMENLP